MSKSTIFLLVCLSYLFGIFLSSFFALPNLLILEPLILGILYLLFFKRNKKIIAFSLCLIFLSFGMMRISYSKDFNKNKIILTEEPFFYNLREKFNLLIFENLPQEEAQILSALLLGNKISDQKIKEDLSNTGLSHIVAISGFHLTIFTVYLFGYLLNLGFWRKEAIILTIFFSWLYIIFIGFPASAIRAGVMTSLVFLSKLLGRKAEEERVLLYSAILMLSLNPFLLRFSISFQLSFLAVLGLIFYQKFFNKIFDKIKILQNREIKENLAITFSAQVFIFPLLLFYFQKIPLFFPITNLLIFPIFPLIIFGGILFLFLGSLLPKLSIIFSFSVFIFLKYFVLILNYFSKIKFLILNLKVNYIFLIVSFSFLIVFTIFLKRISDIEEKVIKI
ncbi:MAG: ComEC/Rec2 family competence protein [Minisyncoccia bacterium]